MPSLLCLNRVRCPKDRLPSYILSISPFQGGGVRSGPGEAWTILLLHIISARPSKQPLVVRTFLKVYVELGCCFLLLQEQIKDIIII
jgi:hypothetical protein